MFNGSRKYLFSISISLLFLLCSTSCNRSKTKEVTLSGIGATFPVPFYNILYNNYNKTFSSKLFAYSYSSGAAIRSLIDKTVDVAATDSYLTDEDLQSLDVEVLHIPTCLGGVAIAYNLPGIKELRLTGPIVADIYLRTIRYWDDLRIQSINPHLSLPHTPISLVNRSDGSGTTFVFSDYLCRVSPQWQKRIGVGRSLNWEQGIAVAGNKMIGRAVQKMEGAIGYICAEDALLLGLSTALLQNRHGQFVGVTKESLLAATMNVDYPDDMRLTITDSPNEGAYPLSCFSWMVVYKNQAYFNRPIEKKEAVVDMLTYMISPESQSIAGKLSYAPLPQAVVERAQSLIKQIVWEESK